MLVFGGGSLYRLGDLPNFLTPEKGKPMRFPMTVLLWFATASCLLLAGDPPPETPPPPPPPPTPAEQFSYAIGLEIGASLKHLPAEIDPTFLFRGIEDVLRGNPLLFSEEEAEQIKRSFFQQWQASRGQRNAEESSRFLEENKKKEGILTTPSGLQYQELQPGQGPRPKATDRVKVHYRGTLLDGTEFDSSHKRGEPVVFQANQVIPGWQEALQLMNVGSRYRLFIPPALAYGERGAGQIIGPNAALIFEVELLGVER
jgi:FKBP-type peptidyl-prolyl cis-trans isomerase